MIQPKMKVESVVITFVTETEIGKETQEVLWEGSTHRWTPGMDGELGMYPRQLSMLAQFSRLMRQFDLGQTTNLPREEERT